jgi:hypothetical protein
MSGGTQFGRAYKLIVSNNVVELDLSALHFKFLVKSMDIPTPNTLSVRVYNLTPTTSARIRVGEFSKVTLSAGYQAGVNYGQIFTGDIKHVHIGRERNVDNYVEILAGDGDSLYNFGLNNTTVGAGASPADVFNVVSQAVTQFGVDIDDHAADVFNKMGGILPRGAVISGLFRTEMSGLCRTADARWSIQQGRLIVVPNTGCLQSPIVKLNSKTGLIGVPEATDNGINIRMLLNGNLQIAGRVQVNEGDINAQIVQQQSYPNPGDVYFPAQVTTDGVYRVVVLNHSGDTRGQEWYTDIVGLSLDAPTNTTQQYPGSTNAPDGAMMG